MVNLSKTPFLERIILYRIFDKENYKLEFFKELSEYNYNILKLTKEKLNISPRDKCNIYADENFLALETKAAKMLIDQSSKVTLIN